ncbi:hypothetical protein DPEC_G00263090 [Dallia pectoralis]|uniref:Uncharacterized protein n=1 Tax=Dallia pectoralis TaxID=75939 RepID=A0ACC2FS26_DALPE|nr:hypothetical protein DPEC_G00263090 [Dallia pectoralis]
MITRTNIVRTFSPENTERNQCLRVPLTFPESEMWPDGPRGTDRIKLRDGDWVNWVNANCPLLCQCVCVRSRRPSRTCERADGQVAWRRPTGTGRGGRTQRSGRPAKCGQALRYRSAH